MKYKKSFILSGVVSIIALAVLILLPADSTAGEGAIASWYGGSEKLNKYTANGEIFNAKSLTCASWYYPFNTCLKVVNIANGKSVIVRVNDRGPNKRLGRAIDLTRIAFARIADTKDGLALVRIEKIN